MVHLRLILSKPDSGQIQKGEAAAQETVSGASA